MRTRTLVNQLAIGKEQLTNVPFSYLAYYIQSLTQYKYSLLPIAYCRLPILLLSLLLVTGHFVRGNFFSFRLQLERLAFLLLL